jgi:ubiquinone biosynthesis protein Coq4
MKLSQISKEPQLIELSIDDEDVVKEYGEPLSFFTWDRQPMDVFTRIANIGENGDMPVLLEIVKTLILDDEGNQILTDKNMLPTSILMKAMNKVTAQLGK